jgi:hypothetical protein
VAAQSEECHDGVGIVLHSRCTWSFPCVRFACTEGTFTVVHFARDAPGARMDCRSGGCPCWMAA